MRLVAWSHRNRIGRAVACCLNQVLWISYDEPPRNRSHSYDRKPSYRAKERYMLELLVTILALAACCLLLVYDHLSNRL